MNLRDNAVSNRTSSVLAALPVSVLGCAAGCKRCAAAAIVLRQCWTLPKFCCQCQHPTRLRGSAVVRLQALHASGNCMETALDIIRSSVVFM